MKVKNERAKRIIHKKKSEFYQPRNKYFLFLHFCILQPKLQISRTKYLIDAYIAHIYEDFARKNHSSWG